MQILVLFERLHKNRILGQFGHNSQLDLRIIRHNQLVTGGSDKTASEHRIGWNLLKVGIGTSKSSGVGANLHVIRMDGTGVWIDFLCKIFPKSADDFFGLAILQKKL